MHSICVFLGSNPGVNPVYAKAAEEMGIALASSGIILVYGGSNSGCMKILADSVLKTGGKVIGVTVKALKDKEIFHPGLTRLHVTSTLNERKALMAELSEGFAALPGGVGTFEEFFEIYTLSILGFHTKPLGVLNINGYYNPLNALLDHARQEGFLKPHHRSLILQADTPARLLKLMMAG